MAEPRVIKRYANRKLYDTQRSRYVTLEQIRDMIKSGEEVQIVDNTSKEDLTAVTLAQIIFEEEKRTSFLPLTALQNIIQSGGQSIQTFASNAGEKVRGIFRRKEDGTVDTDAAPEPEPTPDAQPKQSLRDFLERSQATFDEWQKKVDERIRHAVESVQPWSALEKELRSLTQRLGELEKKLEERD